MAEEPIAETEPVVGMQTHTHSISKQQSDDLGEFVNSLSLKAHKIQKLKYLGF